MKTLPTTLPGVVLLELDVYGDHRGRFMETFRRDRYREIGVALDLEFVQDNFSSSAKGILRGLHHQLLHPQGKLVLCTRGEIWDVCVDVRRGSPTFGQWFGCTLSADNHRQIWIPPGFAHGFVVVSEQADVTYKVTAVYAPADEKSIRWNDPDLAIEWPLHDEPTLSARDKGAPLLRDSELPVYTP
ncbi:MAG TPA: dTDP-4-dehydrorhamnose 3,5-epimerase [Kofleriaceae bacterium]|nr:dTDP-4-dehydrorhamnose 3,5-epimerase [Kofleriaceae bacterium]